MAYRRHVPLFGLSHGRFPAGNAIYPTGVGRRVKLSAFTVVDEYHEAAGSHRLQEVVDLAEAADRAGLSALWVAEHHFLPSGACPAPPVLLAACGARTRRLRLGSLVSVLPFHSPIELAEQFAVLDRLLDGRLNLGVGSGYIPTEFAGFGIDPASKRERFDARYATLLAALRGEEVHAEVPGAAPVRINVRPLQSPHPPIWIAVQRREAVAYVARRGVSVALIPYATLAGMVELRAEIRDFRDHLPSGVRAEIAVGLHLYAGVRLEAARSALQRYLDSRRATQSAFYLEKVRADPHHAVAKTLEESGWALFGSAPDVARRLRVFEDAGVDEVLGIFDFGGLPPSDVVASVTALGQEYARRER